MSYVKQRIEKGDARLASLEGDMLIKYVLKINEEKKISLDINIDPNLINFWTDYEMEGGVIMGIDDASDYILGHAWMAATAHAFAGKSDLGNEVGNRNNIVDPYAWFPKQGDYELTITVIPDTDYPQYKSEFTSDLVETP